MNVAGDRYRYSLDIPAPYHAAAKRPLVVVIHGCNSTDDEQAAVSGYDAIAAEKNFLVLYPDVDAGDVRTGRCWKGFWRPADETRGHGDARAIAEMTRAVVGSWNVDASRIYVIGISSGAFEASMLGADYPDVYAAIGIHSGAGYLGREAGCLKDAASPANTRATAKAAVDAMGGRARPIPVILFHGDEDNTIPFACGRQALAQWLQTDDLVLADERRPPLPAGPISVAQGAVPNGHAYTVSSYSDASGCPIAQFWAIHAMGHYWSGGSPDPTLSRYTDPRGPSAAAASWAFFSRFRLSGPIRPCS